MESNRKVTRFAVVVLLGLCAGVVVLAFQHSPENPIMAAVLGLAAVVLGFALIVVVNFMVAVPLLALLTRILHRKKR